MKKVIVTGATGFIGSHLIKELLNNQYEVYAIVRPASANRKRLEEQNNLHVIELDLRNISDLDSIVTERDFEFFFHIGWEGVSGEAHIDADIQLNNVSISVNCVRTAARIGCKRFIGAGSIHETECKIEMEEARTAENKRNYYKAAKLLAHYYCKLEASACKIDFLWPRLTNTYGEGEFSARLISLSIRDLINNTEPNYTKGDQLYDFIYITDVVRAYRMVAENGKNCENYIIGSGNIRPLKEYLKDVGRIVNPQVKLNFGSVGSGVYLKEEDLYNEKLFLDTGFEPMISFTLGVSKTKEWILNLKNERVDSR